MQFFETFLGGLEDPGSHGSLGGSGGPRGPGGTGGPTVTRCTQENRRDLGKTQGNFYLFIHPHTHKYLD